MARALEPLLWRRFVHTTAIASTIEAEDIDLDLAANEGILVMGIDFQAHTQISSAAQDRQAAVVARPSAETSISSLAELLADTDLVAIYHMSTAIATEGAFFPLHDKDWRPPGDGLVIARRMTYIQETAQVGIIMSATIWYKRLIFTNDEMIGLLIRRR